MSKEKNKSNRTKLFSYDPTETPEEVIAKDKDENRKQAFREAYKKIANIIPEYFINSMRKRKNATSGGGNQNTFSQNIVVTTDKATIQTKEVVNEEVQEKGRERE